VTPPKCCRVVAETGDRIAQTIHVLAHSKSPFSTGQVSDFAGCSMDEAQRYLDAAEEVTAIGPATSGRGTLYFSRAKERTA